MADNLNMIEMDVKHYRELIKQVEQKEIDERKFLICLQRETK